VARGGNGAHGKLDLDHGTPLHMAGSGEGLLAADRVGNLAATA
jgi:hypothetical protein